MKIAIFVLWALFAFAPTAEAFFPQVIPMRTLCVNGSPEPLLAKLKEQYNEVPKYSMKITVDSPLPVFKDNGVKSLPKKLPEEEGKLNV